MSSARQALSSRIGMETGCLHIPLGKYYIGWKRSDSFLSLLLNDIIAEVQTTWRVIDLEYRIKYIFKGTGDKGHEIADCHGTYMLYDNMQREEMSSPPEYLHEGFEFPGYCSEVSL